MFMDTNTGDQIYVGKDKVGDEIRFLSEGLEVNVTLYNGNANGALTYHTDRGVSNTGAEQAAHAVFQVRSFVEGERRLENHYQEQGYFFVNVTPVCSVEPAFTEGEASSVVNKTESLCSALGGAELMNREVEKKKALEFIQGDCRVYPDDATFARSAAAFDNPDHVDIVIHNYRWRLGLAVCRDTGVPQHAAAPEVRPHEGPPAVRQRRAVLPPQRELDTVADEAQQAVARRGIHHRLDRCGHGSTQRSACCSGSATTTGPRRSGR